MRPGQNRGTGAELRDDDVAAVCFLYSSNPNCADRPGGAPPEAPTALTAEAVSSSTIQLTWLDNADDENQFQVERNVDGSFTRIATLGANATTYRDESLEGNTTYVYRVRARRGTAASAYSSQAEATTPPSVPPPAAPTNLDAEALSSTEAFLTWIDASDDETSFAVEQSTAGGFVTVASAPANGSSTSVADLAPYTNYTFRVRALGAGGPSIDSPTVSVLTFPLSTETPAAPSALVAIPQSPTEVLLSWIDNGTNEIGFEVHILEDGSILRTEVLRGKDLSTTTVSGLTAGTDYVFGVKALGATNTSSVAVAEVRIPSAGSPCTPGATASCHLADRFKVEIQWRNQRNGEAGRGSAEPVSDKSSTYWFFSAANTELIVKVLDGRLNIGNFWVFYGALTDVEYWLTVSDTETGVIAAYYNPPGNICGGADTMAIPGDSTAASLATGLVARPTLESRPEADGTACGGTAQDLCLLGDRFRVEVAWMKINGEQGVGISIPDSDQTGSFWFFNDANVELVVKMLDGRANNGHHWFFYGALSNVHYEITVTDTQTGAVQSYVNDQGNVCGQADVRAF